MCYKVKIRQQEYVLTLLSDNFTKRLLQSKLRLELHPLSFHHHKTNIVAYNLFAIQISFILRALVALMDYINRLRQGYVNNFVEICLTSDTI